MAVTTITKQTLAIDGLEATYEAGALSMQYANTGKEYIDIKNGATEAIVTIGDTSNCSQGEDHSETITVTASEARQCGPYPTGEFNDTNGNVQIAINDVSNVTIAVIEVPLAGLGGA